METYTPATEVHLIGDEAMAVSLFARAANAIVARSDLSNQLSALTEQLRQANDALSILSDIKSTQEERIRTLESNLENALNSERQARLERDEANERAHARQLDIDMLDDTVANLRSELAATRTERDDYGLKHMEAVEDLTTTQHKLDAVIGALEKVGFKVEALVPEQIGDGRDDPDYRREPEPIEPRHYEEPFSRPTDPAPEQYPSYADHEPEPEGIEYKTDGSGVLEPYQSLPDMPF